jgi:IS5 family transposase
LVDKIKKIGKQIGKSYRTYCRVAQKAYLGFSKKRKKTRKAIDRARRQMLQYVRRNIGQLKDAIERVKAVGKEVKACVVEKLKVSEQIFRQQLEMYRNKTHRVKDRIVSFCRPYVRPIKRGKSGKEVEFGPKASLSHVDGFLFLDKLDHDNFSEADTCVVKDQIESYERRFGKKPPNFIADKLYGSRENRELLNNLGIRAAFSPLGRKKRVSGADRWFKQKQRERNRIEGNIGNGKAHYSLDRILYKGKAGAEMWVRGGILGMNLKIALKRM